MSLYGSLYAAVSGLKGQSTKIGIISDNIANVNTVGYKAGQAQFETLVTGSGGNTSYSPGGVLASNRQLVDKQGLLQTTDAPTDVAIAGSGMFVVNEKADMSGQTLYTRAGSFRQDNVGNFINAAGFYLQGWPLDQEGRLPGEEGNLNTVSSAELDSLQTVNVENSSGVASNTTTVEIGANLDAGQTIYPGAGATVTMDINNPDNYGIAADDIIIPDAAGNYNSIIDGDSFDITTGNGLSFSFTYGGITNSRDVVAGPAGGGGVGNIFDASSPSQAFFTTTAAPTGADATFTITTATAGTVTFTYKTSSPSTSQGQFNNLNTLATAIDDTVGFTARVVNDVLYIAPEDASEAMTFADGGATGWVAELGVANTAALPNRFATMAGLAALVNDSDGIAATVFNPLSEASLELYVADPLDTITFADNAANTGSLLAEFGPEFATSLMGGAFVAATQGPLGPAYDSSGAVGENMASGDITAQFSRSVRVFDSLGTGHDLRMSFIKVAINTWVVEIYAPNEDEITTSMPDGQVATGTIEFNGDGSLRSVTTDLLNPVDIVWTNGSQPSEITFNWGTAGQPYGTTGATVIGLTDGLSQFDADYNVAFVNQNGAEVGSLVGVTIDEDGFVIANYSNGETKRIFKLPIADFSNPNALRSLTGNVFAETEDSGPVNLREAGTNGVGTVSPSSLESSNVDLAEQLTDMIVAQRAYQANTKVITTSDTLLEELTRI